MRYKNNCELINDDSFLEVCSLRSAELAMNFRQNQNGLLD